jgi:hypothetical protein
MQRMDQRRHQLGARATQRMAQCDRAAVDVQAIRVGASACSQARGPARTPR